jgi:hypothetical protein
VILHVVVNPVPVVLPCHPNPRTYLLGSIELIQTAGFNGFYELGEAVVECVEEHIQP